MTNLGIHQATLQLTNTHSGARPDANKVIIILTDGHSTEPYLTEQQAINAHRYA